MNVMIIKLLQKRLNAANYEIKKKLHIKVFYHKFPEQTY